MTLATPKTVTEAIKKLDTVEATTMRTLTPAQATILENTGKYNDETIIETETFLGTDGDFVECEVTSQSGGHEEGVAPFVGGRSNYFYFKGYLFGSNRSGYVIYSNDKGVTWNGASVSAREYQPLISDDTACYITLSPTQTPGVSMTKNGYTWYDTSFTMPESMNWGYNAFYHNTGNGYLWFVFGGNYSETFYFMSTDDGTTWTKYDWPDFTEYVSTGGKPYLFSMSDRIILIYGSTYGSSPDNWAVYESTDGITWTAKGHPDMFLKQDNLIKTGEYIFNFKDDNKLYKTSNGTQWTEVGSNPLNNRDSWNISYAEGVYVLNNREQISISTDATPTFGTPYTYNSEYSDGAQSGAGPDFILVNNKPWHESYDTNYSRINTGTQYFYNLKELSPALTIADTAPTSATEGYPGKLYVDKTNGNAYICVGVSGSTYTWMQITLTSI